MSIDVLYEKFEGKLSKSVLEDFYQIFEPKAYSKNDYFAKEGEPGNKIGIVMSGVFQMYVHKDQGQMFIKDFLRKTDNLVSALVPGTVSTVNLQAVTDAVVLVVEASVLSSYMLRHPDIAALSNACLNIKYAELYEKFELYATKTASEKYDYFRERYPGIEDEIPQYLVASYLGITPTQLSRVQKQRYINTKK